MIELKEKPKGKLTRLSIARQPSCSTTMYEDENGNIYEKERWKVGTTKWFLVSAAQHPTNKADDETN